MAISSTISRYLEVAGARDFARDNLFRVMSVNVGGILSVSEDDLLYCKGGKLPKRTNPTSEVSFMGMKLPYNTSSIDYSGGDYSLEFYIDRNSEIIHEFERASRRVFNDQTTTGNWRFPTRGDTIVIAALDFNLNPIEYITFHGVAFKGFGEVDTKTADGAGVAISVTCSFSYHYYERVGSDTTWD